jgi:transposase-like protein
MAHTDACKIQVTQFVKKLTEKGMSINQACQEAERESDGIPAETIRYWWKQIQKETTEKVGENSPTFPTPLNPCEIPEKPDKQVLRDEK